jgi:molybdenum cofactor guanylyltransferase
MGRDKALIEFQGEPLILRPIRKLAQVTDRLIVITNHPQNYGFLNLPLFRDLRPGTGALGGLYTALKAVQTPLMVLVACDMPFVSPDLIREQYKWIKDDPDLAVVIPESEHGLEPLHSLYRVPLCLPAVQDALQRGERRMISWHHQVKTRQMPSASVLSLDPTGLAFWNLNNPGDLAEAERLVLEMD